VYGIYKYTNIAYNINVFVNGGIFMDLDTTIRSCPLDEEHVRETIEKICSLGDI
jgi:hypothetical protein